MALTELTVLNMIEVLPESGVLQVRHASRVFRDEGTQVGADEYFRVAYEPGADLSAADPLVQQIAALVWTPAMVEAVRARKQAENEKRAAEQAAAADHQKKVDLIIEEMRRRGMV